MRQTAIEIICRVMGSNNMEWNKAKSNAKVFFKCGISDTIERIEDYYIRIDQSNTVYENETKFDHVSENISNAEYDKLFYTIW